MRIHLPKDDLPAVFRLNSRNLNLMVEMDSLVRKVRSTMDTVQLIYVSQIVAEAFRTGRPLEFELESMLRPARIRNENLNLTGLLIYSSGHFLQVLEGHPKVIERLFSKISHDRRHCNVESLAVIDTEERMFSKWQMALLNLDEQTALDRGILERFMARLDSPFNQVELEAAILCLLTEFKSYLDHEPVAVTSSFGSDSLILTR